MRMMKNNNNETVMVIGIDHGYGNMKTATRCFPSGVARYDKEPIFQNNLLVYNGMYYQIGEEHKEFCAEKTQDEDYYVLTLAAIARELDGKGMNRAKVHIAAGLPLTWVATQKEDFQKYLLQNESVDFIFRNKQYHVEFAGADIYPQGFAAAFYRLQDFKGINMLVDIGNGTMNIMYINNSRPLEKKCFTEKYGTHDLKEGLISKEEFDDFRESYGRKCEELEQMIENQKKLVKQMFEGGVSATVQLEDWKKSLEIKELDRTLLALTVDKIYIYENKQIKIHIRYQDMIEKMKVIRRFYAEHRTECRKEVG